MSSNWKTVICVQNTQTSADLDCNEPDKDKEESGKGTIFEHYTFTEVHTESMIEPKQNIMNKLAVLRHANMHDLTS